MEQPEARYDLKVVKTADDTTYVSLCIAGERYRFSISGMNAPYTVEYLQTFERWGIEQGRAWFPIAPESAARPRWFEEEMYALLIRVHEAELAHAVELAADEAAESLAQV